MQHFQLPDYDADWTRISRRQEARYIAENEGFNALSSLVNNTLRDDLTAEEKLNRENKILVKTEEKEFWRFLRDTAYHRVVDCYHLYSYHKLYTHKVTAVRIFLTFGLDPDEEKQACEHWYEFIKAKGKYIEYVGIEAVQCTVLTIQAILHALAEYTQVVALRIYIAKLDIAPIGEWIANIKSLRYVYFDSFIVVYTSHMNALTENSGILRIWFDDQSLSPVTRNWLVENRKAHLIAMLVLFKRKIQNPQLLRLIYEKLIGDISGKDLYPYLTVYE